MYPWISLCVLLSCLALASCDRPPGDGAAPPELSNDELRAAEVLYEQHCALCHGPEGRGDGPRQSGLTSAPADFTNASWRQRVTFGQVFDTIEHGKPGTSMPAWPVLDRDQVRLLAAYVLSLGSSADEVAGESPGEAQ